VLTTAENELGVVVATSSSGNLFCNYVYSYCDLRVYFLQLFVFVGNTVEVYYSIYLLTSPNALVAVSKGVQPTKHYSKSLPEFLTGGAS